MTKEEIEALRMEYEKGRHDAIEEACKWLRRTQPQVIFPDTTIERFKKAMEEQRGEGIDSEVRP